MPALPEICRRAREVGHAKICHELNSHPEGDATSDGGIAVKVPIDLKREGVDSYQSIDAADLIIACRKDPIADERHVVSDNDLGKEPTNDEIKSLCEVIPRGPARIDNLREQPMGALNRARHQLRKKCHIESEVGQACGGLGVSTVDIDRIAQGLKGVEGDAYWQNDVQGDGICFIAEERFEEPGKACGKEVEVFEDSEDAKVGGDR